MRNLIYKPIKSISVFLLLFMIAGTTLAQQIPRFNPDTVLTVTIDSPIVIRSSRLTAETFINEIIRDTSFYEAFRAMKHYTFTAENNVFTYDKQNRVNAKIYRLIAHHNQGQHEIVYLAKQDSGKVYKRNGKYQLYTVEMFDYIFMNANNTDFIPKSTTTKNTKDESYKDKLKTLIFSPGKPIKGLPFIGSKTQIFTPSMRTYYDYSFYRGTYLDSIPVYRFKISLKPNLSASTKSGLMIKELTTIFDMRNFQILGRYIDMKYANIIFNFDVQMNIELGYFGLNQTLLPTKISYQGNWNIPFKKEERASFLVFHKGYELGKQ